MPLRFVLGCHNHQPVGNFGNVFAQMEATLILAAIAQRFRLSLVPGQRITPTPYITLRPEPGIRMSLARRRREGSP